MQKKKKILYKDTIKLNPYWGVQGGRKRKGLGLPRSQYREQGIVAGRLYTVEGVLCRPGQNRRVCARTRRALNAR